MYSAGKRSIRILALLIASLCSSIAPAQVTPPPPSPATLEFHRGMGLAANPATQAHARDVFVRAKGLALDEQNVTVLLNIAREQLRLRDEAEAVHCYDLASQVSYDMVNHDPEKPDSGRNCGGGYAGLTATVAMWGTLRTLPMKQDTGGLLYRTAVSTFTNAEKIRQAGCPPPSVAGQWTISQTNPGGQTYTGMLNLTQSGTYVGGNAAWDTHRAGQIRGNIRPPATLEFTISYDGGLVGSYSGNLNSNGTSMIGACSSNKVAGTCKFVANR